jgi:hypothetical protein
LIKIKFTFYILGYLDDCIAIETDEISLVVPDLVLSQLINKVYAVENIYYDLDK